MFNISTKRLEQKTASFFLNIDLFFVIRFFVTPNSRLHDLAHSREWPLTPTSDEARALVCDHQMKPDGRVFERDVWLDGRTHVVRPAAASGRATEQISGLWPDQASASLASGE